MTINDFRSEYLPYGLELKDKKWIVFNRRYESIGRSKKLCVKVSTISKIAFKNDGTNFWLYDDGSVPTHNKENMQKYLKRLERLSKIETE